MTVPLGDRLTPLPCAPDDTVRSELSAALPKLPREQADALATVAVVSPFLRSLMLGDPARLDRVLAADLNAFAAAPIDVGLDDEAVARALRRRRAEVALSVGLADLVCGALLEEVCSALSAFADQAVQAALATVTEGNPAGLVVLGLGKLGTVELNYSSDIDIIVLFDPVRGRAAGLDQAGAVRITRQLVRLLQERTEDGYVFRVDLRLRPDPGSTPIAVSTAAALRYYQSRARAWERQAMTKARAIAGDEVAASAFFQALEPTLWPASFDFTAIEEVFQTRERIAMVRGAGSLTLPGHNVKLGRGGIREAEFFVQSLQRLAGGRDRRLRSGGTVAMLAALTRAGWIDEGARDALAAAYERLRRIEHRLQMVADEQTHTLPGEAGLATIAIMMREDDFAERTVAALTTVHEHFTSLPRLVGQRSAHVEGPEGVSDEAGQAALNEALDALLEKPPPSLKTERARRLMADIRGPLGEAVAGSADPDAAVAGLTLFFQRLPAGVDLLARLQANPDLVRVLVLIVAATPRLAEELAHRSRLLDVLVDPAFFGHLPDQDQLKGWLAEVVAAAPDYEAKLDALRRFGREQGLLIHVRTMAGALSPRESAHALTKLAEVLVRAALGVAADGFVEVHGRLKEGAIAVLGLGSFGSAEMTAASDLDLVVIYDCASDAKESDGRRGLSPGHYYTRLTQRLIAALAAPTAEGMLYEADLRLRPSGKSGPIASHINAFERYQAESAWTWEHMALTRARFIAGDEGLGVRALAAVDAAIARPREPAELAAEVAAMRGKMEAHGSAGLKHGAGGQVDVEFIVQHGILGLGRRPHTAPSEAVDVTAALRALGEAEALPASAVDTLTTAHGLFRGQAQLLALASAKQLLPHEAPAALQPLLVRAWEAPDMKFLTADLDQRRQDVRALFENLIGKPNAA